VSGNTKPVGQQRAQQLPCSMTGSSDHQRRAWTLSAIFLPLTTEPRWKDLLSMGVFCYKLFIPHRVAGKPKQSFCPARKANFYQRSPPKKNKSLKIAISFWSLTFMNHICTVIR